VAGDCKKSLLTLCRLRGFVDCISIYHLLVMPVILINVVLPSEAREHWVIDPLPESKINSTNMPYALKIPKDTYSMIMLNFESHAIVLALSLIEDHQISLFRSALSI
jgi:hypothetical protein